MEQKQGGDVSFWSQAASLNGHWLAHGLFQRTQRSSPHPRRSPSVIGSLSLTVNMTPTKHSQGCGRQQDERILLLGRFSSARPPSPLSTNDSEIKAGIIFRRLSAGARKRHIASVCSMVRGRKRLAQAAVSITQRTDGRIGVP